MTAERDEPSGSPFNVGQPAPGRSVGGGRYRLVRPHGGRLQLQFWQGTDVASQQDVALTLVDPAGESPEEFVHEILARTVRLKGIDMPGVARVLEVFHARRFGVVVSEWIYWRWDTADRGSVPKVQARCRTASATRPTYGGERGVDRPEQHRNRESVAGGGDKRAHGIVGHH
jgi:hypothetical protein